MAHPQAVGVEPLIKLEIGHGHAGVIPAAAEERILMLAGAFEIKRLAVDQELMPAHLDTAEAERLAVFIGADPHQRCVEIRRAGAGLPQAGVFDLQRTRSTVRIGNSAAVGVQHGQLHIALTHCVHGVVQLAVSTGHQRDVADISRRGRVQADGAGDARIVEEVEVRQVDTLHLLAGLAGLDCRDTGIVGAEEGSAALIADRQRAVADPVIDLDLKGHGVAGLGQRRDIGLKGQETAAMGDDLLTVEPHNGIVGHGIKPQHTARALGHGEGGAVVGHAVVAAELRVGALVVVGRRHRDGLPWLIGIEAEIPHAGKIPDAADSIGLRIHSKTLSL